MSIDDVTFCLTFNSSTSIDDVTIRLTFPVCQSMTSLLVSQFKYVDRWCHFRIFPTISGNYESTKDRITKYKICLTKEISFLIYFQLFGPFAWNHTILTFHASFRYRQPVSMALPEPFSSLYTFTQIISRSVKPSGRSLYVFPSWYPVSQHCNASCRYVREIFLSVTK